MAEEWLAAPSKTERERIFKRTGIRWSELLRLSYWDPTRFIVVDAMHNLFLNLVKFHIEHVVGIREEEKAIFPTATTTEMIAARKVWAAGTTETNQLKKVNIPALLGLCKENNIILPQPEGRRLKRATIVGALVVSVRNC